MKRIYYWIEEAAWRLDSLCHEVIEWANFRRTGKTISEQWEEMAREVNHGND